MKQHAEKLHQAELNWCQAFLEHRSQASSKLKQTSMPAFFASAGKRKQGATTTLGFSYSSRAQIQLEADLIDLYSECQLAYSLLDNKKFKKLIHNLNSNVRVPSSYRMTRSLIPDHRQQYMSKHVTPILAEAPALALSTDGYRSVSREKLYTINLHAMVPSTGEFMTFNLCTKPISGSEDADNIARFVHDHLKGLPQQVTSKIQHAVTDRASAMIAAMNLLNKSTPMCNVHMISTALKRATKASGLVQQVQMQISSMISKIRNIREFSDELERLQRDDPKADQIYELIPLIDTRFVFLSISIARLVRLKKYIVTLTPTLPADLRLRDVEWVVLEALDTILSPLQRATEQLSAYDRPTLPFVYGTVKHIVHHLKTQRESLEIQPASHDDPLRLLIDFVRNLEAEFAELWSWSGGMLRCESTSTRIDMLLAASLLHPVSKSRCQGPEHTAAEYLLQNLIERLAKADYEAAGQSAAQSGLQQPQKQASTGSSGYWQSCPRTETVLSDPLRRALDQARDQVKEYLRQDFDLTPFVPRGTSNEDVFRLLNLTAFWQDFKGRFPIVYKVNRSCLSAIFFMLFRNPRSLLSSHPSLTSKSEPVLMLALATRGPFYITLLSAPFCRGLIVAGVPCARVHSGVNYQRRSNIFHRWTNSDQIPHQTGTRTSR